ncbi:MAG TPA: RIP metalloprotease RseP, partial [Polyangia bacterium]|nr:RIP metalloprotease RseP [Polyangia bacterium]
MSMLLWAAAVLALLGVLILVHELGHFIFAKLFDVKVLRFSLGFGPRLFGLTWGDTEYRLSLFPLGGYIRLLGEDPSDAIPAIDRQRALGAKPLWQRYTIVIAGPVFNLLLPLLIYFIHYAGQRTLLPPTIGTVLPNLPAAQAGLLPGDKVETVDGKRVYYWEEVDRAIADSLGRLVRFGIRRGSEAEERDVTPIRVERIGSLRKETVGWIGVSPRFHLPEIGVLDPTSPAGQAGLKSFDIVMSVNGIAVATWADLSTAIERAGASPLRLNYLRGGYSAVPFAHIEIQQPSAAVVIPVAVFDGRGRRRYETGILPSDLFVFTVDTGTPADQIGIRSGDQILELDGQPLAHWEMLLQRLKANPDHSFSVTWLSQGGERRQGTFRQEVRSVLDAYRQEDKHLVFGAVHRLAEKT